jgi:hypothetical protein
MTPYPAALGPPERNTIRSSDLQVVISTWRLKGPAALRKGYYNFTCIVFQNVLSTYFIGDYSVSGF